MGKEFIEIFEQWADSYDATVTGQTIEYVDVFLNYKELLEEVANRAKGHVLEFGVGTGNLTQNLIDKGHYVTGIEPSSAMRKIANEKLGDQVSIFDGDFLDFPEIEVNTIVSTYAFHHLTNQEKETAFTLYGNLLKNDGKIVFADTMYESEGAYEKAIENALAKGFLNLAEDLQREYYPTIPILKKMFLKNGFQATFERWNDFVWIMEAVKQ